MTEHAASLVLDHWFAKAGLGPKANALVLFGPGAALPHGASGERRLQSDELVLIDAGGVFQGYTADITRTFALPGSKIPAEHLSARC
jgi:Xaa-Pro aminopeptidase